MQALFEETDLDIAEKAIASDLKLLEGLIKTDPKNQQLLLLASQGFDAYALGFVEDFQPQRAKTFYLRGRDYGLRALLRGRSSAISLTGPIDDFENSLADFKKKDVPALFWTANNWAGWINLNFDEPVALAQLPRVQLLMQKVLQLEPSFFFGGAHLFFGVNYAARPPLLGGNIELAEDHFQKCFEYSRWKFLLPRVYYAKYVATRQLDEALFQSMLEKVIATPDDVLPGEQLANAIAKRKAQMLLSKMEEFF